MIKKITYGILAFSLAGLWWYAHNRGTPKSNGASSIDLNIPQPKDIKAMEIPIKEFTTHSGIKIWFVPNETLNVLSIGVCFRGGGERSTEGTEKGLMDLLTSTIDEGYGEFNSRKFKEYLQEKNIQVSASSTNDHFYITARTTSDQAPEAFKTVQGMVTSARFDAEDVDRIRNQLISNLAQSLHIPQTLAREKFQTLLYGENHPYVKKVKVRIENLSHLGTDKLKSHIKKITTRGSLIVAVSGNIDESKLVELVEDTFKDLPEGEYKKPVPQELKTLGAFEHVDMPVPQTVIMFAQPGISNDDPDFYAWNVAEHILGGNTFRSRLWKEVRETRGLAYGVGTDLMLSDEFKALIGSTSTKTEAAGQTITVLKDTWKKFVDEGVTEEEFNEALDNIVGSYPLSFTSTLSIVDVMLGYMNMGLPVNHINERNLLYAKLTRDDINKVIKRLIDSSKLTIVSVGKQKPEVKA